MNSQRKGRAGELELVRILNEYGLPATAGRPMSFGLMPDAVGLPGVHIEVKRVENLNLCAAVRQAVRDSEKFGDGLAAVFHRRNRTGWLVSMRLEDWIKLYNRED